MLHKQYRDVPMTIWLCNSQRCIAVFTFDPPLTKLMAAL